MPGSLSQDWPGNAASWVRNSCHVGADLARIVAAVHELLNDPVAYARMASAANPYGDGHVAGRISATLRAGLAL